MRHMTLDDLRFIRPLLAEEVNYTRRWQVANPSATIDAKLQELEERLARLDEEIQYLAPVPKSKILPPGA